MFGEILSVFLDLELLILLLEVSVVSLAQKALPFKSNFITTQNIYS